MAIGGWKFLDYDAVVRFDVDTGWKSVAIAGGRRGGRVIVHPEGAFAANGAEDVQVMRHGVFSKLTPFRVTAGGYKLVLKTANSTLDEC